MTPELAQSYIAEGRALDEVARLQARVAELRMDLHHAIYCTNKPIHCGACAEFGRQLADITPTQQQRWALAKREGA